MGLREKISVVLTSSLIFILIIYGLHFTVANADHSQNDCLAIVVLTHGVSASFIYAKDNPYPVEFLWNSFTADKCLTLAGKPKLFFVQVIV